MVWYYDSTNSTPARGKPLRKLSVEAFECAPPPIPTSLQISSLCSPVTRGEHYEARSMLSSLLTQGRLPNMPSTFPFFPVRNHLGQASQRPFDFTQTLCLNGPHEPGRVTQTAVISFATDGKQFVWRVALPAVGSYPASRSNPTIFAEVRMDVSVERDASWYLHLIAGKPRIVLRALALSLENAVQISISAADANIVTVLGSTRPPINDIRIGDIVYVSRNLEGEAQIMQVVDGVTKETKYSTFPSRP